MKTVKRLVIATLVGITLMLGLPMNILAASSVGLGTANSFAILAGAGITNTGSTTITGNI